MNESLYDFEYLKYQKANSMKIKSIKIINYRSFPNNEKQNEIQCSGLNIIIGANGSGKSNLANALRLAFGYGPDYGYTKDRKYLESYDYNTENEIRINILTDEDEHIFFSESYHKDGLDEGRLSQDNRFFPVGPSRLFWNLVTEDGNDDNWSRLTNECWDRLRNDAQKYFNIELSIEKPENRKAFLKDAYDLSEENKVPVLEKGSGYVHLLYFLFEILKQEDRCKIYLFEEPETHMHSKLQRRFLEYLTSLVSDREMQFFVLTHSSIFVDQTILSDNEFKIIKISKLNNVSTAENITLDSDALKKLIFEDLGYKRSDVFNANGVIWVEGISDAIYIRKWLDIFVDKNGGKKFKEDDLNYIIIPYGGRIETTNFHEKSENKEALIKASKLNGNFFIMMDLDEGHLKPESTANKNKIKVSEAVGEDKVWITHRDATIKRKKEDNFKISTIEGYLNKDSQPESLDKLSSKRDFAIATTGKMNISEFEKVGLDLEDRIEHLYSLISSWNS